jgi:hypothetical protein
MTWTNYLPLLTIMCIVTLDQGHDTSLGPGQQPCEILFKFINRVRSYGYMDRTMFKLL